MGMKAKRSREIAKYERAYQRPKYKMKNARMQDAIHDVGILPVRNSYLDVSCGRREMLQAAKDMGFQKVQGTEAVPSLCDGSLVVHALGHALPFADGSFEVVTMFDVIEHIIPGDDEAVFKELLRVASHYVVLTANNKSSLNWKGEQLHINRRPYEEWDRLFTQWAAPHRVEWIKGDRHYISEAWRISKEGS